MFIIISGYVSISQIQRDKDRIQNQQRAVRRATLGGQLKDQAAKKHRIGVLRAGGVFGELAALGIMDVRSATVEAETLTSMWEITKADVLNTLTQYPAARKHF